MYIKFYLHFYESQYLCILNIYIFTYESKEGNMHDELQIMYKEKQIMVE